LRQIELYRKGRRLFHGRFLHETFNSILTPHG
jgi:hypothetical protein